MSLSQFIIRFKIRYVFLMKACIFIFAGFASAQSATLKSCSNLYSQKVFSNNAIVSNSSRLRSENLINYLSKLLEQQYVRLESLQMMLVALEQGELINPISAKEALNSIKKIIHDGIASVISHGDLDREILIQGLKKIVKEETWQEERRGESRQKTEYATFTPKFYEIHPGKFMMGEDKEKVEVEITMPFFMMDVPVTQFVWARLQILFGRKKLDKINPSKFKTGAESVVIKIDGIDIQMKPDHPVENVSWNDVKYFIDKLNQLSARGDNKIQSLIEQILPGHQKGDIYDFPTSAQLEFVMRDRGNANKKYFNSDDADDILSYAWLSKNSNEETHRVASLLPLFIDGKPFYDLLGNVYQWVKDFCDTNIILGGKDPLVTVGSDRVFRGSAWSSSLIRGPGYWNRRAPNIATDHVGFRLVRIRP